jgi:hypothetical protein
MTVHPVKFLSFIFLIIFQLIAQEEIYSSEPEINIGVSKQLLVDDYVIAKTENITRQLEKTVKANNGKPIFTSGRFYGTIIRDDNCFKMWYRHLDGSGYGYAESNNGLDFKQKANLTGIPYSGDVNLSVMIDPHEKDIAHRFKGGFDALPGAGAGIAYSADGIHWNTYNNGRSVTYRAADTYNQVIWDETAKVYRLYTRTDFGKYEGAGPKTETAATDVEVRGTRSMINPDIKSDPKNWKLEKHWYFNKEGPKEYLRRQIYAVTNWMYEGVHFGLFTVYEWPGDFRDGKVDYQRRPGHDVVNFYIATSRDGCSWDMKWVYSGQPVIPRGKGGSFDQGMIFSPAGVVTYQDRHWLYYCGANERHGNSEHPFIRDMAIGLAWLPQDRIIAQTAGDQTGTIVTKSFLLQGNQLELNADVSSGCIKVDLLNEDGSPIPGFSGDKAALIQNQDRSQLNVKWNNQGDLTHLKGKIIKIRFRLKNAKLYLFQIK